MHRVFLPLAVLLTLIGSAPARAQDALSSLPYGPDTCQNGYVFRDAFADDHVCVTPATRLQVARDNAAAASRVQPGGGAWGPDTCRQGWVWREAGPRDRVCVLPAERDRAARDNHLAYSRQQARLLASNRPVRPHAPPPLDRAEPPEPGLQQCRVGGAVCPPHMLAAYDDNEGCICRQE
ncbi:hypothetical protein [Ideonella sp. B508-1]|uniref:hypothetical protein n=1 Tax=Ideonella sp. B508-1 TaxID=137716 RepID=UPI000348CA16|nr:hypothetical protein [Ideonella sp. B508-1]